MTTKATVAIYPTDTEYTIQERVAAQLDSIPKYIAFDIDLQKVKTKPVLEIDVIDLLKYIRDKRDKKFKFYENEQVRDAIAKRVGKNFSLLKDVVLPFIYFRVSDDAMIVDFEYIEYAKNIEDTIKKIGEKPPQIDITNVLEKKKEFLESLEQQIKEVRKGVTKYEEGFQRLEKVKGKLYTEFELERIEIELETDWKTTNIMSVFNGIVLTRDIPFACLNSYYKVLKGVTPPLVKAKEPGKIFLLIQDEDRVQEDDEEDELTLIDVFEKDGTVVLRMDLEIRNKRKKEQVTEKILRIFPKNTPTIVKERQTGVNGVFYFPKQMLEPVVFSHLLLTDVSFYKTLAINESEKSTKTKDGIYTYFNAGSETVSSVITPKTVYVYDPSMRDKDRELFPEGGPYVSIRISKASSVKIVKKYQETLSKIFSLYDSESKAVIKLYKGLFDPLGIEVMKGTKVKAKTSTKVFLRKLIPEIFTPRYSRSCRKQPIIIDEKDKDKYANALLFPKSTSEGPRRWYACDHKDDKFVGLRINDPKSEYKFVPCCYKLDQRLDRNSWYNVYMKWKPGEEIDEECLVESESLQQNITTTRKLARYGLFGQLSDFLDINTVFKSGEFLRRGMDRSRLSFIQCVFEGLELNYGANGSSCKERVKMIRGVLEDIVSNRELLNMSRQGFYDKSLEEIVSIVSNKSGYFDPRYFIPVLEYYFQCNIYVFTPETLLVPTHVQNFLHLARNKTNKTVIILEHSGTEGENVSHPQCELIVKAELLGNKTSFSDLDEITVTVSSIFDDMCASYSLGKNVTYYTPEFGEGDAKIYRQTINDYGKTACLFVEFNKDVVVLYPDTALPPLPVSSFTEPTLTDVNTALKFLSLPFIIDRKKVVDPIREEIVAFEIKTNANNTYFIPVLTKDYEERFGTMEVSSKKVFFPYTNSFLDYFKSVKQISHYVAEYCKFLFSKFLLEQKLTRNVYEITEELYTIFFNEFVIMDKSYRYTQIPSRFGVVNEGFVRDSKLVVNSEELRRRLFYMLRSEKEALDNYYMLERIDEQFTDTLDFDMYPSQIVLHGVQTLAKFIGDVNNVYVASGRVIPKKKEPYFFRNRLVGGESLFLASDVDSLTDALSYIYNWTTKGFAYRLPPVSDEVEEQMNVSVYNYISADEIPVIHVANSKNKILAYKYEDRVRFVVLIAK